MRLVISTKDAERFRAMVGPDVGAGCLLWLGSTRRDGYGQFRLNGRMVGAHQVAYALAHPREDLPAEVCHSCDVRVCVSDAHLWPGTRRDNARDMASKGRAALQRNPRLLAGDKHWSRRDPGKLRAKFICAPEQRARGDRHGSRTRPESVRRGEDHHAAKLSEDQVAEIRKRRASGERGTDLAREFNVTPTAICSAWKGRSWRTPCA